MIEYHLPLQISGKLRKASGEEMTYSDLIRFLESNYGIKIAAERDRKSEVLSRDKPTAFIEKMMNVIRDLIKKSHL